MTELSAFDKVRLKEVCPVCGHHSEQLEILEHEQFGGPLAGGATTFRCLACKSEFQVEFDPTNVTIFVRGDVP